MELSFSKIIQKLPFSSRTFSFLIILTASQNSQLFDSPFHLSKWKFFQFPYCINDKFFLTFFRITMITFTFYLFSSKFFCSITLHLKHQKIKTSKHNCRFPSKIFFRFFYNFLPKVTFTEKFEFP